MKFSSVKPVLALCLLAVSSGPQTARAAVVAKATIYWDTLDVQLIDLSGGIDTPRFNWVSQASGVNTSAFTEPADIRYDDQSATDFATHLTSASDSAKARSQAERTATYLQAQSRSEAIGGNSAQSSAYIQGDFEMRGKGVAMISLDWKVDISGVDTINPSSGGEAIINLNGSYLSDNYNSSNATNGGGSKYATINEYDGTGSKTGTFRFTVSGDGLGLVTGNFSATASARTTVISSVPVPASAWLFGSALMASLSAVKRKSPGSSVLDGSANA
ncbi:hypothetical protein [Methylomonas koyamae]|uniref:hypothetical protein n=1 Tax=Methylomonas koyamae TaxID=702114 RepID=UPI00112EC1A4|nr:hypothetical protein [Methylomonas koyamae]TPQ26713.1 hypothetical protein C2U68_10840 [Methylomonas koyamae]